MYLHIHVNIAKPFFIEWSVGEMVKVNVQYVAH